MRYLLLLAPFVVLACSSTSTEDAGSQDAGPVDAGSSDGGGSDGGTADAGTFTLTIDNYLTWCTITEDGAAFSPSKDFGAGAVVNLNAVPSSSTFIWGYWIDLDAGTKDTNMSTTATMTADKSLRACCPFPPPASQTCP